MIKKEKKRLAVMRYYIKKYNKNTNFKNKSDPLFMIVLNIFKNHKYNKCFVDIITKQLIKYHIRYYDPYISCDQWKQYVVCALKEIICDQEILCVTEFKEIYDHMGLLEKHYVSQDNNDRFEIYNEIIKNGAN